MIDHTRGNLSILGVIDLEVREEGRRGRAQHAQAPDRHPPDLGFRAFAGTQLEHRPPGPRVGRAHDLRLGAVRQHAARRLTRHLAAMHLVRDVLVALVAEEVLEGGLVAKRRPNLATKVPRVGIDRVFNPGFTPPKFQKRWSPSGTA